MKYVNKSETLTLIKACNTKFYKLLLSIKEDFFAYVAEYDYGTKFADTNYFYYQYKKELLNINKLPRKIRSMFSFYKNNIPFGIVLEKCFEIAVDNDHNKIPSTLYRKGDIFGFFARLGEKFADFLAPPIYSAYVGSRSSFCISNLGNLSLFTSLSEKLPSTTTAPKELYGHYQLFGAINQSFLTKNTWKLKLLFFNHKFLEKILNDPHYFRIKDYLFNQYWQKAELFRNKQNYDYVTSEILSSLKSFKPDPYLTGTLRHFISIFLNIYPAFAPLKTEEQAPVKLLQRVLLEEYKIKTAPILMGLEYFNNTNIIYYPLNYISTFIYSRNYRKQQTIWARLDTIKRLADNFFKKYKNLEINSTTLMSKLLPDIEMHCFHTTHHRSKNIKSVSELKTFDPFMGLKFKHPIPRTSPFLRGLIAFKRI